MVLLHQDSFYNMFLKHFYILTMDEPIKGIVLEKVVLMLLTVGFDDFDRWF